MLAIAKRRKIDKEDRNSGNMNNNTLLHNRAYDVEFSNGKIEFLTTNIIV